MQKSFYGESDKKFYLPHRRHVEITSRNGGLRGGKKYGGVRVSLYHAWLNIQQPPKGKCT